MATRAFTVEVHIGSPKERVGRVLRDFPNYGKIHPLITAISGSEPRPGVAVAPAEKRRWYKVTDRLPLGPIPFFITYDVALAEKGPESLLFEAWQWPRIYLHNQTSWRADESGGTYVREEVRVHAPRLLLAMVVGTAEKAHRRSFSALKEMLESEAPRTG